MKVYVFTAFTHDHGREVIAVTKQKPTTKQMWKMVTEHLRKAYGTRDVSGRLDEYAATNFDISHEAVREEI